MKHIAFNAVLTLSLVAAPDLALAQTMYRIVEPNGRVTFSDQLPPPSMNAKVTASRMGARAERSIESDLPFELRAIVQRFAVTLYTGKDCPPCDDGRNFLRARGIPFTERTVHSSEDFQALRNLSGGNSLPLASVGGQQMKGFSNIEWTRVLDAAGYPKFSQLPRSYRPPEPSPLAERVTPAAPSAAAAATPEPSAPRPPAPAPAATTPHNPSGIRF